MALFDTMNSALAQNGQGPPNAQQNLSPPGFNAGFGNAPPNFAGGMQQFMNPQFMAMLQALQARRAPGGQGLGPAQGAPLQLGGPAGAAMPGTGGNFGPMGPAPGMGGPAPMMPNVSGGGAGPMVLGPQMGNLGQQGAGNLAGGMNPFLRR